MEEPLKLEAILNNFTALSITQQKQISQLFNLYNEWNAKINIISRKNFDYFYEHHVWHSLFIAKCFNFYPQQKVIDIGTGGGFPGIPLAIAFPQTQFFLVDSIGKKIRVVESIATQLQLKNVTTIWDRAENLNMQFDTLMARAVVDLKTLCGYGKKLIKKNPTFDSSGILALKGGDLAIEIQNAHVKPKIFDLYILSNRHLYFKDKYLLYIAKR